MLLYLICKVFWKNFLILTFIVYILYKKLHILLQKAKLPHTYSVRQSIINEIISTKL